MPNPSAAKAPHGLILVVDDDLLILTVLRTSLDAAGYRVLIARSGEEALLQAAAHQPDLVLMDKNMPGLSGVEAMQQLKLAAGAAWTPVIMLSGDTRPESQAEALKLGCDDYLLKPINLYVLAEKVAAFLRVAELHRTVRAQTEALLLYQESNEEEAAVARFLLGRVMGESAMADPCVAHWLQPSTAFSGDLMAVARSPAGELYVMLADATGHGLPAAVTLVPLTQMFQSMAAKGYHLQTIASELNRLVHEYTPTDRFVAVSLAWLNPRDASLVFINAGNPPALLVRPDGGLIRKFASQSVALGILEPEIYTPVVERASYAQGDQLVIFSDGLIEAVDAGGEMFGRPRLYAALCRKTGPERLETIRSAFATFTAEVLPHDDVSLMVVDCPVEMAEAVVSPMPVMPVAHREQLWHLDYLFGPAQLRTMDVVPTVVETAKAMGLSSPTGARLYTVLTELFANALDHGLLRLDSSLKEQEEGFERFMQERQDRLQELSSGEIRIRLEYLGGSPGLVRVRIRDNGEGFDPHARLHPQDAALSGRGISLMYSLCQSVHYLGCGNEVEVELLCQ